ncbi:AraC family transcriptional regulator [Fodinibius halophilus]|uniref:Helix-turn-helix domain-containing protein n=1 Tax=Fodinibius halophilus TaxID=1736908 RepID=A0A6M1T129_9BACT|nr:AraC family transcriptional regulator [Fodinibius halophilus]NGP89206.1 helix-turn-helix domain-containing protein [Fodinibius halophilus]
MSTDKSIYFQIPKIEEEGIVVQYDNQPHFYDQLHHHPELQLVYILEGTGDLFIGDSITTFKPGDLFLFGSNQSHILKSDAQFFRNDCEKKSRAVSIFFHETSLGDGFFDISETAIIKKLIERANRGLVFSTDIAEEIGRRMHHLLDTSGFDRFLETLSILHKLAQSKEYAYLAQKSSTHPPDDKDSERINNIINYILNHYQEDIQLETIAEIANYSKTSFCRFFKKRTRKTFTQFLNEVRVAQACKLLRNSDMNISRICYESGFNNVSNFNRQFKRITETTPKNYAQKFEQLSSSPHIIQYNN